MSQIVEQKFVDGMRLYKNGYTMSQAAQRAGCTASELANWIALQKSRSTAPPQPAASLNASATPIASRKSKSVRKPREWTDGMLADLAKLSAVRFRKKYGINFYIARRKRIELGIPILPRGMPPKHHFTDAMIALFGKRTDEQLARSFHMGKSTIGRKRESLGIPAPKRFHLTDEDIAKLGKVRDSVLAKKIGCSKSTIMRERRKRNIAASWPLKWSEATLRLLGKTPDNLIARTMGVCTETVMRKRVKLGIRSYYDHLRVNWKEEDIALLGTMPSREIARILQTTRSTVQRKIVALGLPPYKRKGRTPVSLAKNAQNQ